MRNEGGYLTSADIANAQLPNPVLHPFKRLDALDRLQNQAWVVAYGAFFTQTGLVNAVLEAEVREGSHPTWRPPSLGDDGLGYDYDRRTYYDADGEYI